MSEATETTECLITAARRGERWAEEELVSLVRSFARHVCTRSQSGSLPDIDWEDVGQEAARRLFAVGLGRFEPGRSVKSYVYAYTRNAYLELQRSAWRRRRREEAAAQPVDGPGQASGSDPETRTLLYRIMDALSADCRELLARIYFDGATYAELAAALGIANSSVRARASRCLGRARELVS